MRIGDICVYAPKSQIKAGEAVEGAKYMFFTSGADENKRYCDYQLEGEGIIMGTGGNATLHYYSGKYAVSTDCVVLMPDEIVRCKYLYYFFKANINVLEAGFKGAGLRHTNKKYIDDIIIKNIPGYDEQDKIIRTLDKLQDIVDKRNHELCLLDSLIKARFVEMFGDPVNNSKDLETNKLKNVLTLKAGDFTDASEITETQTEDNIYPCYGGNGIRGYVKEYNHDGDYSLIGRQGALSGNVQFANGKFKNTEHALLVTPLIDTNSIWLYNLLQNLNLKRYQTGAAQPGISIKNLQEIDIISVSINKQNQFADFVKQVDKSKLAVQESLEKTQQLFDSLMQEYFG